KLSLPDLTPTCMTLELGTRYIPYPAGIAEDVFVQVGKFRFPADFIVVNYDIDPRVPLILGRLFLRTAHALVNIHGEELILRDGDEKLIFHADSTLKNPHKHGNDTTPLSDSSPNLTPFETSDSLLEEFSNELALLDSFPLRNEDDNFDFGTDLGKIEYLLNQDLSTDDLTLPEESSKSSEIATLSSSPFENEDKVFKPGILILGRNQIFNDESKDKDYKVNTSSKALIILEECNFLSISSDQELLFFLELTVIKTLSFFSKIRTKVSILGYSSQKEFTLSL
nr:reverse transcriptase domain-containing protein [Tanacetum cinerariifolium]